MNIEKKKSLLWSHQRAAVNDFRNRTSMGLGFEQGTGKTATAILSYMTKVEQERRFPLCICLVPNNVVENWASEWREWAEIGQDKILVLSSGNWQKTVREIQSNFMWNKSPKPIIIVPHSKLSQSPKVKEELAKVPFEYFIMDESHRAKNSKSIISKVAAVISDRCKYKQVLSGTPILNSYEDIWGQMRLLGAGIVGTDFWRWRKQNFYDANFGKSWAKYPDYRPTPEGLERIKNLLQQHWRMAKKSEVLDLPPLVKQVLYVDQTKEVEKHYKEMFKNFVTSIESSELGSDDVVEADLIISKMLRCQQIVSGILQGELGTHEIPTNKDKETMQLLEDLTPRHKVIVWCNFKLPIQRLKELCKKEGYKFATIVGGQSTEERQEEINRFNTEESCRVMIASQKAGGVGVNLQAASYMIYYSKGFSLEEDLQSEARAYRGGSEIHKSITRIDLVTRWTIEEDITTALRDKMKLNDFVYGIKEKYMKKEGA